MGENEMTFYGIHLAKGGDWMKVSNTVNTLKGNKGLSIAYDAYTKTYTVDVWEEERRGLVMELRDQAESLGGVFKVAALVLKSIINYLQSPPDWLHFFL